MSEAFSDPGAPGGDTLPLADLIGSLLLFTVEKETDVIETVHGPSTAIACSVAVLDGDRKSETFGDTLIFPKVLKGQLRKSVGGKVLGRLGQGEKQPGKNAPWILLAPTDDDKATAHKYVAFVATQTVTEVEEGF